MLKVSMLDMLRNYRRYVFLLAVLILTNFENSSAYELDGNDTFDPYCKLFNPEDSLQERKIENIEILTDNKRRWTRNILGTLVEFNNVVSKAEHKDFINFRIEEKYKRNHKATLFVKFKNKDLPCKFKSRIRITGDGEWHLKWKNGNPLASVYVKLLDGHINSITKFKLFLPAARGDVLLPEEMSKGGETEVFVTTLLRDLGFLAPRTHLISAKVNGVNHKYIFQEDLRKEFLEQLNFKEGPILEGDERFTVMQRDEDTNYSLSLSRLTNKNFSLRGETNARIALRAVSNLNLIYLQNHQIDKKIRKIISKDILLVNTEKYFFDKSNKERFQIYESLMEALGASHGQSKDDRRFYFDPINGFFVPIYYDGKATIISRETNYQNMNLSVTADAKLGSLNAIKLISKINHDEFIKKLNNSGFFITHDEYKILLERLVGNLRAISIANVLDVKFLDTEKYFSKFNSSISKDKKLVFINFGERELNICNFDLKKCSVNKSNDSNFKILLSNMISQRYKDSRQNNLSKTKYLFVYDDINYQNEENFVFHNWNLKKISKNFILKYNKDVNVDISKEDKSIKISQIFDSGRVIFTGNKIEGWNIMFSGYQGENNQNVPKDYLGLTGCLTFIDTEVSKLNVTSKNSRCEDSINFIRVQGQIDSLEVSNSLSDAIDFDFSNLVVNNIKVKSARNDCVDLSAGRYKLNELNLINCGDKALSVGEKSFLNLKKIIAKNANIGIASKDSSIVKVNDGYFENLDSCLSAYNKKQEFDGGFLEIANMECKNYYKKISTDIVSKIVVKNNEL